ncbi:MAG: hypothetical protein CL927_07755 [Deltaproteobacteria bacterium]|nr:hypothetical protein [Deltaproteobacteria bacterium]HCH65393.1 hypothetical protein [Deltaproteobacteria bacterium]
MAPADTKRAFLRLLFPQPNRLGFGAALVGLVTATAALALAHPSSPLSWSVLAGVTSHRTQVELLDVANAWTSPDTQADALWQAAVDATGQQNDSERALSLLGRLLRDHPTSVHTTSARAQRAMILDRRDNPASAEAWKRAAESAPEHPRAGRWWLAAADRYSARGLTLTALEAYQAATAYPSEAALAWIAIGRLNLAHDAAVAHRAFSAAATAAQRPSTLRIARLGVATALERLEGPEAALAEVDEVIASEGSDPSLERRRDRLRNGG